MGYEEQELSPDVSPVVMDEPPQAEPVIEKKLKLRHGIVLLILVAGIIYFGSPVLYSGFGFWGTAIGEVLMLILSILTVLISGARMKRVFQFRKPELKKIFGTILLWIGSYLLTMTITMIMELFFPVQVMEAGSGLEQGIMSVELAAALLIVSLSPAICEEMVFRGVFFNCVWNKLHRKWATILIVGLVFGIFHGSVWRFVPTAILGIAMGYVMFETNNMFYNMLFHGINNAVPVLLMFLVNFSSDSVTAELENVMEDPNAYRMALLPGVGLYVLIGALGLFILYLGRNIVRYQSPRQPKELRMMKKREEQKVLVILEVILIFLGFAILVIGGILAS